MKFLYTLIILFFVSFASAQDNKQEAITINTIESKPVIIDNNIDVVISVKGIKRIEDIDIEDYNRSLLLNLIARKELKSKLC